MKNYQIILGSKSPRRKELLGKIITDFTVKTKEVEEIYSADLPVIEVPQYLAQLKAKAFEKEIKDNQLIITSDTIVALEQTIFGKPKDRGDAVNILKSLSGKKHQVHTGVCLFSKEKRHVFVETTDVFFKELGLEEINYYIDNYQPFDKAGAYGIQEWIGMIGISKIEGDYSNVVGLPLYRLNEELKKF